MRVIRDVSLTASSIVQVKKKTFYPESCCDSSCLVPPRASVKCSIYLLTTKLEEENSDRSKSQVIISALWYVVADGIMIKPFFSFGMRNVKKTASTASATNINLVHTGFFDEICIVYVVPYCVSPVVVGRRKKTFEYLDFYLSCLQVQQKYPPPDCILNE